MITASSDKVDTISKCYTVNDMNNQQILELFGLADKLQKGLQIKLNKIISLLFFQPSTRTRAGFEAACKQLQCQTIVETNPIQNSACAKQETLADLLKTKSCYTDCIILRHPVAEDVFSAIDNITVPIINAGWGSWEHPSQALIDLYTFYDCFKGQMSKKNLALVGDLDTRTAKSIAQLAKRFEFNITLIYPKNYPLPSEFSTSTNTYDIREATTQSEFYLALKDQHIVYYSNFTGTELSEERINAYKNYYLSEKSLQMLIEDYKKDLFLYSPLPRRPEEMDPQIDKTKYGLSFAGVKKSLYLRMALLTTLLT